MTPVEIISRLLPQRFHQLRKPKVSVVVCFQDEIVGVVGEEGREGREERIGLAAVHVLRAVEDDDVVVEHDFERQKGSVLVCSDVAEDKLGVDFGGNGRLERMQKAESLASFVSAGDCEDAHQEPELGPLPGFLGEESSAVDLVQRELFLEVDSADETCES